MPKEPASWPRPHFAPGGGDALLFYAVFGNFDLKKPLSKSKYRTSGLPDWLELAQYDRAKQPEAISRYQGGKVWEVLKRDMPLVADEAERAPQCVALRAEVKDPTTLDYFRDTIGVVTWLLDAGGVSVYDPQMLWLWAGDEWKDEAFGPGEPNPDRHTTIMVSAEDGGTSWYHTRGMRKYGRPDLSVHGVGEGHADAVYSLIERFVEFQAFGGVIADGEEIRMKALPPGGVCRRGGSPDDPDFNNVHVAAVWPAGALK
jgi:hypothetical protein